MKTAYLDCFSGISGDMMVGGLIDIGLDTALLKEELKKLPLEGYEILIGRKPRSGIYGADFSVSVQKEQKSRTYRVIREMIEGSGLKEGVKALSLKIFEILALAEGKVHGVSPDDVHFHEVGAVDSIIDIVATAIGIDHLNIGQVFASPPVTGRGFAETEHGMMPVPAPATAEILLGIPFAGSDIESEMVTPTGAAILKALVSKFGAMPQMNVEKIGYGAGDRDFIEHPNLLRIFLGELSGLSVSGEIPLLEEDEIVRIETSIDDMNPQFYDYLAGMLFEAGALDVVMIPVYMKKGRPGTLLQILAPPSLERLVAKIVFTESTAIGIRTERVKRLKLKREKRTISTHLGEVSIKILDHGEGLIECRPEYDSLKKIAKEQKLPIRYVREEINAYLLKAGEPGQTEE